MSPTLSDAPRTGVELEPLRRAVALNPAVHGPILLATDGTSQSGAPVLAARLLAEHLGLPLEVVTVLEPEASYGVMLGGTPIYMPEVEDARRTARVQSVLAYVSRFSGGAALPSIHVRFGSIAEEVAEVARER